MPKNFGDIIKKKIKINKIIIIIIIEKLLTKLREVISYLRGVPEVIELLLSRFYFSNFNRQKESARMV